MTDDIDLAVDNVKKGLDFSFKNYRKFFPEMLKVTVLSAGIVFGAVIIIALLFYAVFATGSGLEQTWLTIAVLIAFAIIVILAMTFTSSAVESVVYNIMDRWGKKTRIIPNFKKNFKPIFFYTLALIAINIVVFIPVIIIAIAIAVGGVESALSSIFGELFIRIYQFVAGMIVAFILQFALFELIIARTGVIASIKKSYSIAKKTFIPTVVFDILAWVVGFVASLVLIIVLLVVALILGLIAFVIVSGIVGSEALILPIIAFVVLLLLIFVIISTAVELTVTLPMKYFYWKKAREIK